MNSLKNDREFQIIFDEAAAAGRAASQIEFERSGDHPYCGSAWVVVRPGTSSFAKWLKRTERAKPHYAGGVQIYAAISDAAHDGVGDAKKWPKLKTDEGRIRWHGQSQIIYEACAEAFAKALEAHGIQASVYSYSD